MSFDSISEKIRQRITTTAMASWKPATTPPINNMGAKAAMVVKTPMVEGMATFFAPSITSSIRAVKTPFLSFPSTLAAFC